MPRVDSISKWGAYGYADAVVDGKKYRRDLIFLPDGTVKIRPGGHGWWGDHNFKGEELDELKKAGAERAIIGVGMNSNPKAKVSDEVRSHAREIGLDLLVIPSPEAVEKWNELSRDDKKLAAIIHITC